ncbi:MAG: ceramide glucosyltransferase [Nitrospirae bacterium]|nr:ceramide glucosyltransferase [Nitrospirota bacterium]
MEIFWIFAGITIFGLVGYGLQILAVRSHILKHPLHCGEGSSLPRSFLPISILKPLKGLDDNLFDNLESFCLQDYPEYEIIFSLQDYNDPAYKVVRKIKDKYPDGDISIIVERCDIGLNPKVNNLIHAYKASKYAHILISDSNVVVDKAYLREISKHMEDPDVGLVSSLIKGTGGHTVGSVFENLHLNSFVVGSVCFLDKFLKMPCVVGKSMLMGKRDLEAIGGLRAVKDILAEDYIIGERMHRSGKKVVLSDYMISNVNEYWGIKKFLNRHTRWGKLRWKIGGIKYLSELIGNPVFMACLPVLLWEPSKTTISFALLVSLVKTSGDFYLGRKTGAELNNPFLYMLSPVKDLLIGIIWFIPLLNNTIVWRGSRYIIGRNSMLSPCAETGFWSLRYRIADAIKGRFA